MPCLCYRLLNRQFHHITQDEIRRLEEVWAEAIQHFPQTQRPTPRNKRPAPKPLPPRPLRPSPQLPTSSPSSLVPAFPTEQSSHSSPTLPGSNVINLAKTYSAGGIVRIDCRLDIYQSGSKAASLFLAIERSGRNIQTQKLFRRICCYTFAQLHEKHTSISSIAQEIQKECPDDKVTTTKIEQILRIGRKWVEIVQSFRSIAKRNAQELTGLLCLLESASNWERARSEDCQSALTYLFTTTDIFQRTLDFTHIVDKALKQLLVEHSFVDETHRLLPFSNSNLVPMPKTQSNRSSRGLGSVSAPRAWHTVASTEPTWKASLVAVSSAILGTSKTYSEDASILLVLLTFFSASANIPFDLLLRGASPRKRWDHRGEIQEVDSGLALGSGVFLSNNTRLSHAFHELTSLSAVSKDFDGTYTLTGDIAKRVHESLPAENIAFWKSQALIIAYRAIPWKYLESTGCAIPLILPHLEHTLKAYQCYLEEFPPQTKTDLVSTLAEASRFSTMVWKRSVLTQLDVAADGLQEQYVQCSIAASRCLVSRLDGRMDQAASTIDDINQVSLPGITDERLHSARGQIIIQRALNCIQVEDLSGANVLLASWQPLGQKPSPMESIVLFRKHMLCGKTLRFQGTFTESLAHLQEALAITKRYTDVDFDDDLRDLTCELADALLELDDAKAAENHLQAEITRRNQSCIPTPRKALLDLSLAEALFAQQRFENALTLCLDVNSRPNLLKFEKLRLNIIMAKTYHMRMDHAREFTCWGKAMEAAGKFELANGRTTRMIVMSICGNLSSLGYDSLLQDSKRQLDVLDKNAKPGGTQYWIAGMRHWDEYLQSRSLSRM